MDVRTTADCARTISLTLEEVEQMLDDYVRTEGNPEVVQFSGGEPTIHPQIIDFVRAAKDRNIPLVMINTNGTLKSSGKVIVDATTPTTPAPTSIVSVGINQ